jgi:uncharacterized protein YndB with AHSA1/START domain
MSATDTAVGTQTYRLWIKATPEEIWKALTDPETLGRYGYGGKFDIDVRPGGSFKVGATDQMLEGGAPELMVDGEYLEVEEPRRLVQTWHALFDEQMTAEPPTTVTYEIEPAKGGVTKLTVIHEAGAAPLAAAITSGQVAEAGGGFPWVLNDLKTLLETGETLPDQM